MLEETLEKLFDRKLALFELTGLGNTILKSDLRTFHGAAIVKSKQTAIADGNPMDIGRQIFERSLTITHGLAMHNPLLTPDPGWNFVKEFQFLQTASESCPK